MVAQPCDRSYTDRDRHFDSGDGVTHVIACAEDLMQERGETAAPPEDQLRVAGKVKENFSYVCQDIMKEFRKFDREPYKYFERDTMYVTKNTATPLDISHPVGRLLMQRQRMPKIFW
ncbi:hypothetical protein FB446DRAFT_710023 [Lentinula raphanica]|nr:hypothetical protein FB446DRAFT_710023 [Lentinula raphanica]